MISWRSGEEDGASNAESKHDAGEFSMFIRSHAADQRFDQDPGGGFYAKPGLVASVQSKPMSLLGRYPFNP
jgi:hypothetical protein